MRTSNDRGAIMLIAVFFAIFGVAILYYMIGMSQAVLFRERMQDAADATALSDAIANARGMNFIVLINIVMAALLAILVTIKLVEGLTIIGMFIAAALAWATFGATLSAIPPLRAIQSAMNEAYNATKPPVYTALDILNTTATAVAHITPLAADGIAAADVSGNWGESVTNGIAIGSRETSGLPVEDDSFDNLCEKAGTYPARLASEALGCPAIRPVFDKLSDIMGDITKALSAWFCGDASGGAPKYEDTENASYPKLQSDDLCNDGSNDSKSDRASDTTNSNCEEQKREQRDAQPDDKTGSCQAGHDCTLGGPYDARVVTAREQCDPTQTPAPNGYTYQYRTGQVYYKWVKGAWQRLEPEYGNYVSGQSGAPPCGPPSVHPTVANAYNKVVRQSQNVDEVRLVCSNETVPPRPLFPTDGEISDRVDFIEVTQILGCTKSETKRVDFNLDSQGNSDRPAGGEGNNQKSPKRVETHAALGDESFQLRSLILGTVPTGLADNVVRLPSLNQAPAGNPLSALEPLGKIAFAQAEYYYEGTETRPEWMWNMKWRARLRRFRLSDQSPIGDLKKFAGPILPDAVDRILDVQSLSIH